MHVSKKKPIFVLFCEIRQKVNIQVKKIKLHKLVILGCFQTSTYPIHLIQIKL